RHAHRVGAGVWFGDSKASDPLAGAGLGKDIHLLFFRCVAPEVVEAEGLACADSHGQGVTHTRDRLINEERFHISQSRTAILFLKDDSVHTQVPQLLEKSRW